MKSPGQAAYDVFRKNAVGSPADPELVARIAPPWEKLGPEKKEVFDEVADVAYLARVAELNELAGIRMGKPVVLSENTPTHHSYAMGIDPGKKSVNLCLKDDNKQIAAVLNLTAEGALELGRGLVRNLERLEYDSYAASDLGTELVVKTRGFAVASGPNNAVYLMGGTEGSGIRSCLILDKPATIRLRKLLKEAIDFDAEAAKRAHPNGSRRPARPN